MFVLFPNESDHYWKSFTLLTDDKDINVERVENKGSKHKKA